MTSKSPRLIRPKICVISTTPLTIHFFLKDHLRALADFADVVLILNPNNDSYTPDLDLPVRMMPIGIRRDIAPLADIKTLKQLIVLLRQERPDLVWAVTPKGGLLGMLAALFTGIHYRIFVFQGEVWASKKGFMRWLLKCADIICARCATHLLAVSSSERLFLESENVVPVGRVRILGSGSISGVDLNRYRSDSVARRAVRVKLGIPLDAVVALFVGRLTEDKGVLVLAEAFQNLATSRSDVWLVIVGPDEQGLTPKIKELLGATVKRCKILNFTHQPERYMAAADYICLPSYREGFGMVIIEAAGVGIPAIGSRIHGISDAIRENETGILVEVGSAAELYNAMLRLSEDTALRQQLGISARRYVTDNFSSNIVIRRYVEMFQSLLT